MSTDTQTRKESGLKKAADFFNPLKKDGKPVTNGQRVVTLLLLIGVAVVAVVYSQMTGAYTTPATGDPGYDMYDLVINKGLDGPVGFVIGSWLLINAGTTMGSNPKAAALQAIGGGALIKAEEVANTLGALF